MDNLSKIRRSIKSIASIGSGHGIYLAEVVAVSGQTCSVRIDSITLSSVRLRATINTNHQSQLLITPKVGSLILVADLSDGNLENLAAFAFSEIERVELTTSKIVLNGGKNDGTVKIQPLIDQLNALENDINKLKSAFSTWTPIPNDGGATLKTAATNWATSTLKTTTKGDLENPEVLH